MINLCKVPYGIGGIKAKISVECLQKNMTGTDIFEFDFGDTSMTRGLWMDVIEISDFDKYDSLCFFFVIDIVYVGVEQLVEIPKEKWSLYNIH